MTILRFSTSSLVWQWNLRRFRQHSLFQRRFPILYQRWLPFISSFCLLSIASEWKITSFSDLKTFSFPPPSLLRQHMDDCCWLGERNPRGMSIGICNVALFIFVCAVHMGCWHFISPFCEQRDANEILKLFSRGCRTRGWKSKKA